MPTAKIVTAWSNHELGLAAAVMPSAMPAVIASAAANAQNNDGLDPATLVVAMAWSLAWEARSSGRIRVLMFGTIALTLAVPGPVAGMALKLGYRWFPWVHDTSAIVVMGEAARILPYASVIAWLAIAILPRELLESAALDGYGPSGQAAKVLLPLTWGPMVAAWFVSFVISFGELPASNLLLPPGLTTISFQLWSLLHTGVESHLAGVALVTLAVTGVLVTGMLGSCLLVSRVFARR